MNFLARTALAVALAVAATGAALAQGFPNRPIRLVVVPAGRRRRRIVRTAANRRRAARPARRHDNRPGSNGNIAAEIAARSA